MVSMQGATALSNVFFLVRRQQGRHVILNLPLLCWIVFNILCCILCFLCWIFVNTLPDSRLDSSVAPPTSSFLPTSHQIVSANWISSGMFGLPVGCLTLLRLEKFLPRGSGLLPGGQTSACFDAMSFISSLPVRNVSFMRPRKCMMSTWLKFFDSASLAMLLMMSIVVEICNCTLKGWPLEGWTRKGVLLMRWMSSGSTSAWASGRRPSSWHLVQSLQWCHCRECQNPWWWFSRKEMHQSAETNAEVVKQSFCQSSGALLHFTRSGFRRKNKLVEFLSWEIPCTICEKVTVWSVNFDLIRPCWICVKSHPACAFFHTDCALSRTVGITQ